MSDYDLLTWLILQDAPIAAYSASVTPPAGTIYTLTDNTFTATTNVPSPVYTWSVGAGDTIVSGQGTASVVVKFGTAGTRTVSLSVTGGGTASASWSGAVVDDPYLPSLDYSDARNSIYRAMGL